ncbi:restriction endonuclease subunit S [Reinekea thalattae]|uniref:Specificity determinant for hsdM and hsdR n=1 Tax=Reinekea thalattae TaxID=2593301 RepID=A0A5C8Z9S8_9GAMM|nr:restriction endonuclease subunit S [Reinekea thalattae]TXR54507.1 specificity determinant for hsdM and hsdR [Reinekea thalattae]
MSDQNFSSVDELETASLKTKGSEFELESRSWASTYFTDVLDVQGGTQPPKAQFISEPSEGYVRLLQIRDFGARPVPTYVPETNKLKKCTKDDVLIGRYGASLGRICTGMEGAYNVALAKVISTSYINKKFIKHYLEGPIFQNPLALLSRSAQNGFNKGDLESFEFPLPPLAEQKVIADKLDILLAQVESTKARLQRLPDILKRFRQSVLSAAVSGKLTEEWRIENPAMKVNVSQIAQQHRDHLTKAKSKYREPLGFKTNELTPEIPKSWRWYRAEELCDFITKGTTPKKDDMATVGDIPYIKVYNLTFDGSLDFTIEPTFIPKAVHDKDLKRSKVFPGDVLINIVGPPLGKVSIVPSSYKEWNINQAISIFRPVCGVSNRYLSVCLRDEYLLDLTKSKAKATVGQFNLTLEICRDYSIPVPPFEEQTEIVRRVEELFQFADQIEQKANAALERVNNLTQSILTKAFRGELTADWRAQNPDLISGENSAEALLEKIKAEREALTEKSKPKKKTVRKKAKA